VDPLPRDAMHSAAYVMAQS